MMVLGQDGVWDLIWSRWEEEMLCSDPRGLKWSPLLPEQRVPGSRSYLLPGRDTTLPSVSVVIGSSVDGGYQSTCTGLSTFLACAALGNPETQLPTQHHNTSTPVFMVLKLLWWSYRYVTLAGLAAWHSPALGKQTHCSDMSFPKCVGVIVNQTVKEGTGCGQIYKNAEGIIQASPTTPQTAQKS